MTKAKGTKKGATKAKAAQTPPAAAAAPSDGKPNPADFFDGKYPREHHGENPGPVSETTKNPKTPSEVDAFRRVLEMMDVASGEQLDTIVEYCSQRDLRNLVSLDSDLWDMGVSAVNKRRRVILYWARSMGMAVDPHLQNQYRVMEGPGSPEMPDDRKLGPRKFFVDEDSAGNPKIRLAKQGEVALTMKEANDFVRQLRDQTGKSNEAVIVFNEALGRHMPNSSSQWVQQNMAAAWSTAREYDRLMTQGEPPDPIDLMVEQMTKVEALKGVMHPGGNGTEPRQSAIDDLLKLEELIKARGGGTSDPLVLVQLMKAMTPESKPDPMIDILREQNVALREQSTALMSQVNELRNLITTTQFESLKRENQVLAQAVQELKSQPRPGEPTAMTIMKEGITILEREAKGVRSDLKDLGKDLILSDPGNAAGAIKGAIGRTERLEDLTEQLMDLTGG